MKYKLISILIASLTVPAFAGSATAAIRCESHSGRTLVEVGDEDLTSTLFEAKVKVDSKEIVYDLEKNPSQLFAIYDFENKVIALTVKTINDREYFKLWAIPSTVNIKKSSSVLYGTFTAYLEGTDPRGENDYTYLPQIQLRCTLNYVI